MEVENVQGLHLPCDIDDTLYIIEKASEIGGKTGYKIVKCFCYGFYNFGNGWKIRLHTNRNKFKHKEYDVDFHSMGYIIFKTKKNAEACVESIGAYIEGGK